MKYYKWNLLVEGGFALGIIILGVTGSFVKDVTASIVIFVLACIIMVASLVTGKIIKHDIFDEAAKELEAEAYRKAHLLTMAVVIFLEVYFMLNKKPIDNVFSAVTILYGIIYGLPSFCYAILERKILKQVKNESEE